MTDAGPPGPATIGARGVSVPALRSRQNRLAALATARWAPDAAFAAVMVHLTVTRYRVLTDRGSPATIDAGNWLAFGHALLGDTSRSSSIVYPPVVPLLVVGLTRLLGPIVAVGLMGALSSAVPAISVFVAMRLVHLRWAAVGLAALLAASASIGEAAAWGGFPQLIGIGAAVSFLVVLDHALTRPTWGSAGASGALLALVLLTSHFVAVFALLAATVVVGLALLAAGPGRGRWLVTRLAVLGLCLVPAILVLPLYVPLLTATAGNQPNDAGATTVGFSNLLPSVQFTFRDAPVVWRLLALFALCAPVANWDRWRRPEWRLAVAALVAFVVGTVATHQVRFMGFLPIVAVAGAALWALAAKDANRRPAPWLQALAVGVAATVLVVQSGASAHLFEGQREFYGVVEPGTFEAMDWLRRHTDPDAAVGVASVDDAPMGWWIEGYGQRPTYYGSSLQWLAFPDELRRARVANSIFTAAFPDDASVERAARHGIDLLLIPTRGAEHNPAAVRRFVRRHPESVAFRNADVVVLRTR